MRKRLKTLLVLCATLCLALFGAVFAACNDPDGGDTSVVYSVTVQNEDGDPLSGQFVQFCVVDDQGNEGVCYTPVETDENGVAELAGFRGTYSLHTDRAQAEVQLTAQPITQPRRILLQDCHT